MKCELKLHQRENMEKNEELERNFKLAKNTLTFDFKSVVSYEKLLVIDIYECRIYGNVASS